MQTWETTAKMTTPYDPAQNQPPAPGQQPMPPTAQFPQVPAGQYPPPPGQFPQQPGQYPPPPGGWQQPAAPAAPAARKRPWLIPTLIGVGAFVVLCCGGSMVIGLASDNGKKTDVSASSDIPAVTTSTSAPAAAAPAPTALAIPAGHKMTPAKWCTTYAKVFIQLEAKRDKISDLRGTQYKNGVALDNAKRTAQADALWAEVEAFDPGQAIADALVSLPHSSYEEAALAAPDGANANPVNVAMWHAYDDVGRARDYYVEKWDSSLFGPDDAGGARSYASSTLTDAIGEPPNGKPGSGKTGLCYVQQPYEDQPGGEGTGGTVSTGGGSAGCEYHGRPRATWKVWRWGDWSC